MEWSGQQGQVPQNDQQPAAGPVPTANYYGSNPLQPPVANPLVQPGIGSGITTGQPMMPTVGTTPAAQAASGVSDIELNDNASDVNDTEWVNRAKRAISTTHGDPHRQVQLIQHLRSQYLKQRFGRTVHTDKA